MPVPEIITTKAIVGRPVDAAKTEVILKAASETFFRDGFAKASIEAIAASANVSKVTIYNRFSTKEALFVAVVEQECDIMRQGLAESVDSDIDIRSQLTCFAENMVRFLARDDITRMEAHLAVETENNPELGKLFLDAGPRRLHSVLADILDIAVAQQALSINDTFQAAELFAGMVKGLSDMDRRFRQYHADHDARTERRIASAVDLFVRGYG